METVPQKKQIKAFVTEWLSRSGDEKSETQTFWLGLLQRVFGKQNPGSLISFEKRVKDESSGKHKGFIDARIDTTRVLIEQKKAGTDLEKPEKQSDGTLLTPYEQALRYDHDADADHHALFIVTCNFREFRIHDMRKKTAADRLKPEVIKLENLAEEYSRLFFLVDTETVQNLYEQRLSIKAGAEVNELYKELKKGYPEALQEDNKILNSLNVLCVRLVFCCYAEDALLFGNTGSEFHDALAPVRGTGYLANVLVDLFRVLDTPEQDRKYLNQKLNSFPYVSGGLFADTDIVMPFISKKAEDILLDRMSAGFNWAEISPTIFGAIFESTLNTEIRRTGGMHYTSVENIHKVIDPLFLTDLKQELRDIQSIAVIKTRNNKLLAFQEKLASLRFLDPACGSGNFLTETYLSLRRMENEIILTLNRGQGVFGFDEEHSPIKVNIGQFYGIEINDFAVSVAKTALWIAESQMFSATQDIVNQYMEFFPLKSNSNIVEGNALTLNWETVVSKDALSFIMGNPPFSGARFMTAKQKSELMSVFGPKWKNSGNLDYVSCWFKVATDYMQGTSIRAAFVATNSLTQGEAVADIWKPLFEMGIHFDFAWRSFLWDSQAKDKAHVYCVVIGFSYTNYTPKLIFDEDSISVAANINGYLTDAPAIFIESRGKPISDVPLIGIGNKPIDGGNYLFTQEEKDEFVKSEPASEQYFKRWYGAEEFINNKIRYCLWLGEASLTDLVKLPECQKRIVAVRDYRLKSKSSVTRKIAEKPRNFHVENIPNTNYIVIPQVSSQGRRYIPIGFLSPNELCSDKLRLMPDATLFHFGVLTSSVHMAWVREIAGRLKMDFSYSVNNVYNNFPWCEPSGAQRENIAQTAQAILNERAKYPSFSYAVMYGKNLDTLFLDLKNAHIANDKAVMDAYGFAHDMRESQIVAELLKLYQAKTSKQ